MHAPWPYRFPNHADEIYREAMEYRRLSPSDRLLAIVDLMALGEATLRESPNREYALAQWEAHERQWQIAHREVLARHGF
jgi:hypothetical protein